MLNNNERRTSSVGRRTFYLRSTLDVRRFFKFFQKILTDNEIAYCFKKKDPFPSLAVRFAAKEALIKAIGSEINVNMKDIYILNDKKGRPILHVENKLEEFFMEKQIKHYHLSLSHEKEFGVACVVLEK